MFGNPAAERAAIEHTYEDTATISRPRPVTENNITRMEPAPLYEGIPCALSYTGGDGSGQTRAQNNIDWDAVLFAAPELDVQPGDGVEVRRFGRLLRFAVAGRPAVYATHQEIKVKDGDLA